MTLVNWRRRIQLAAIANGEAQVVVGTHALFQEGVEFAELGLIVIDEQHRFGVHQRLSLRDKSLHSPGGAPLWPHQLVMTATPIPRTLNMALSGIRDLSVIETPPVDRLAIRTYVTRYDEAVLDVVARMEDVDQVVAELGLDGERGGLRRPLRGCASQPAQHTGQRAGRGDDPAAHQRLDLR